MKKLLFAFSLLAFVGTLSLNAQTCPKMAAANKEAAVKLASQNDNIEVKTCAKSGTTSFYEKSTCATSGKVTLKEVKYDGAAKKFVNVAPMAKDAKSCTKSAKACCAKGASKACCSKTAAKGGAAKATATSLEGSAKKSCTKSKASCSKMKSSCAKKAASEEL